MPNSFLRSCCFGLRYEGRRSVNAVRTRFSKGCYKDEKWAQVGLVVVKGDLLLAQGAKRVYLNDIHLTLAGVFVPLPEDCMEWTELMDLTELKLQDRELA